MYQKLVRTESKLTGRVEQWRHLVVIVTAQFTSDLTEVFNAVSHLNTHTYTNTIDDDWQLVS